VNPLHGIGGGEWQAAGQHFIQRDAERIQIAAAINRTIHSSRLFGRHVGQCSGENLGRFGRLPIAWQPRCDTEAHQPHFPGCSVHESVGGLDVLVDETALVQPTQCGRQSNGEPQELSQLHRCSHQSVQRLASGVPEHEHRAALVCCERNWPNCPGGLQFGSQ